MRIIMLTTTAMVMVACTGAATQSDGGATFEELDVDGDQYITWDEAQQRQDLARDWLYVDTDTNGLVDFTEFTAFAGAFRGR